MSNHTLSQVSTINPDRLLYSIGETAQLLSISMPTIIRMVNSGKLDSKKIGGRRLIPKASIEKVIRRATA